MKLNERQFARRRGLGGEVVNDKLKKVLAVTKVMESV
jgi:hypothetical protein